MPEPSYTTELGSVEISDKALADALDGILAASLRPVCVGLALFYALLSTFYFVQLEGPPQSSMSQSTALLSIGLLAAAVWFERNQLPSGLAHPVAALIAAAIILNCLFLLVTVADGRQTTNLMIAQLGFGCLLLSVRWFLGLALLSLLGWLWVAGARADDPDWQHFGMALFTATVFGALMLFVRIRAYRNIQRLRMRDQVLVEHLREANQAASIFEKSRMSLTSCSSVLPERSIVFANSRCCLSSVLISSSSVIPSIAVIGVRISWLMFARNSLLVLTAIEAAWLASRRCSTST